ncbi:hypothetical protein ACIBAG_15305 [Streptomyces sp. NPDC051243]|uniref:hypothetical protein n=1 Tax=Streptomyces sp. NPDC051243 TaxID=3365646 RepID=UPI0037AEBEFB
MLVTLLSATACFHGALQDGFGAGPWRGIPVSVITSILMWWCPQHLLLVGRVRWLLCCPEPC